MASELAWPDDWEDRRRGQGCPMCERAGADHTPYGVRVFDGRWSDAYLGRYQVRPGYAYVIWKGRHVAEPTELSPEEAAGFWSEVARVSDAVQARYEPAKMNWLHLGNGVPHLHVHLVPRPQDDPRAGAPLEADAFDHDHQQPLAEDELHAEASALRAALGGESS